MSINLRNLRASVSGGLENGSQDSGEVGYGPATSLNKYSLQGKQ